MAEVQTLAQLQAQVEAEDNQQAAAVVEVVEEAEPEEEVLDAEEADGNDDSEPDGETEEAETPEWAKTPDSKNFVPAKVHSDLRKNLRATESQVDVVRQENEQLKQRLAALESGTPINGIPKMPTLAECDFDDDVHATKLAEYSRAMVQHELTERDRKRTVDSQQEQLNQALNAQVNKHYERAGALIASKAVTEDNFRAADGLVRKALAEVSSVDADYLADYLISVLGEGSEKVMYHLGVSPTALAGLKSAFKDDPNGLKAAVYLGSLNEKFKSAVPNKLSNAPKPDKPLSGGAPAVVDSARKAYNKAIKSDDPIAIMRAEREAKKKGIDTSNW